MMNTGLYTQIGRFDRHYGTLVATARADAEQPDADFVRRWQCDHSGMAEGIPGYFRSNAMNYEEARTYLLRRHTFPKTSKRFPVNLRDVDVSLIPHGATHAGEMVATASYGKSATTSGRTSIKAGINAAHMNDFSAAGSNAVRERYSDKQIEDVAWVLGYAVMRDATDQGYATLSYNVEDLNLAGLKSVAQQLGVEEALVAGPYQPYFSVRLENGEQMGRTEYTVAIEQVLPALTTFIEARSL